MFFSYKKRTTRILNISKGRAPGMVLSPVFMGGLQVTIRQAVGRHAPMPPGTLTPTTTRKTQKTKIFYQISFSCNNSDTTGV